MAKLIPVPRFRALDDNGDPLAGGKLYSYIAGTSTPKDTFTTAAGDVANANPVILDSDGYADIWLETGSYKFILRDSADTLIYTVDNVTGEASNAFASSIISQATSLNVTSVYDNNVIICTASLTLSLLAASEADDGFFFSVKNNSGGNVTIDPDGAELIDGASTLVIPDGKSALIVCNGTAWFSLFLQQTIQTADIADNAVTLAKIQQVATATMLGRDTAGTGNVEVLTASEARVNMDAQQDISGLAITTATVATDDKVLIQDTSDTDNIKTVTAQSIADLADGITYGTLTATTSGTTVDLTGEIGTGANRFTIIFDNVSTTGTTDLLVQLGDAGGIETTGYNSGSSNITTTTTSTAGFIIKKTTATVNISGYMTFVRLDGNTWKTSYTLQSYTGTIANMIGAGEKTLSGEITGLQLATVGGVETFDNGQARLIWE